MQRATAKKQLKAICLNGLYDKMRRAALDNGISLPYFLAIGSRETNLVNELGDRRGGEYHGVGIVQIDIQHPIARQARDSGSWKTHPEPLLNFGAQMLAANIHGAKVMFPSYLQTQWMKIAASAYNCGWTNAIAGAHEGDSDKHTTSHNYGADVMRRMALFAELLASVSGVRS